MGKLTSILDNVLMKLATTVSAIVGAYFGIVTSSQNVRNTWLDQEKRAMRWLSVIMKPT